MNETNVQSRVACDSTASIESRKQFIEVSFASRPINMTTPTLPPLSILTSPSTPVDTKTSTLDTLFEPSSTLHNIILPILSTPFPTYTTLIEAIRQTLLSLSRAGDADKTSEEEKKIVSILGAHPRLGAKKVESALSRMEQERAGMKASSEGETEEEKMLRELNAEYEEKFPGLRYVYVWPSFLLLSFVKVILWDCTDAIGDYSVFVNARPRSVIMVNMRERIARGDYQAEKEEAVNAMCDIAIDRAGKLGGEI